MAENKTTPTKLSVAAFIDALPDQTRRADAKTLVKLMQSAAGEKPKMWGPSIIGFGSYHYKYDSGHEGDAALVGFSPRKSKISLYLMMEETRREELLNQFGKHTVGKACVYVNKVADIDVEVLQTLISETVAHTQKLYPE